MIKYLKNKPCIYKITNPNGRIYIGQTVDFHRRLIHYRNGHCKKQHKLNKSFMKHGFASHDFKIIFYCSVEKLNQLERLFQDKYDATNNFNLNIKLTRTNDRNGHIGQSTKDKIGLANSGSKNGMFGRSNNTSLRKNQINSVSGSNNYMSKIVLNTETGIYYDCLTDAANSRNIIKGSLWAAIVKNKINKTPFIYA